MMRKLIVVGDPPIPGGAVLPYSGPMMDVFGHRIALIGGRAYCEGCNSVGILAKAGGPRRGLFYGAEMALEGDVVICHCPVPPPLVATLVHNTNFDDMLDGTTQEFRASFATLPGWFVGGAPTVEASRKVIDEMVEHPPEAELKENICPNETNAEFSESVLKLRDEAIALIQQRLLELERWDKQARDRVAEWFGKTKTDPRTYLREGMMACERVLRGLEAKNFVRYSEGYAKHLGCIFPSNADGGTVAAVCKPDLATRTIAIAPRFCMFPKNKVRFGTKDILDGDTKLLTLVHEVTHFDDVFRSVDSWYGSLASRLQVKRNTDPAKLLLNADSLAAYILGVVE